MQEVSDKKIGCIGIFNTFSLNCKAQISKHAVFAVLQSGCRLTEERCEKKKGGCVGAYRGGVGGKKGNRWAEREDERAEGGGWDSVLYI